jgi:hypothetical protein
MAKERVQVQGLGGAVPGIQPTIQRAGQYSVAQVRAPRNKLMDLADALSQVNPILSEYGNIRRVQQEQRKSFEEAMLAEGAKQFQLDPTTMTARLRGFEKEARRLTEKGELPEEANAIRMIGAMRAKSEVLTKRDYRAMLLNPDVLLNTTDPEVEILKQREEFLNREEFQSPLIRDHALQFLTKVEDEFRNKVQDRLDQVAIEDGRRDWLELGRDSYKQVMAGILDINSDEFKNWINHPAGIFKGSRKFAWDNLIKEDLKEGLLNGDYTPSQVNNFLGKLRELDLGGGVKYADAETGNAISDFLSYVEDRRGVLENKRKEQINIDFGRAVSSASEVFFQEYKETGTVSKDTYINQIQIAVEKIPSHKRDSLMASINQSYKMFEKGSDEATKAVFDDLNRGIEDGLDLDEVKENIEKEFNSGSITASDYDKLNTRLEDSRDFDLQVIQNPSYKDLKGSYNELITGFRRELSRRDKGAQPTKGHFQLIDLDKKKTELGQKSIYSLIKDEKGESRAIMFVNSQYRDFDRRLRNTLENEFNKIIAKGNTPEQAKDLIDERQDDIAQKLFDTWVDDSINVAQLKYLK